MSRLPRKRKSSLPTSTDRMRELMSPKLFRALCDENRIAILSHLARSRSPRPVGEVACCCPVSLSVVSRDLSQLRESGIVVAERRGKQVLYSLRTGALAQLLREMADAIEACCPAKKPSTARRKRKEKTS